MRRLVVLRSYRSRSAIGAVLLLAACSHPEPGAVPPPISTRLEGHALFEGPLVGQPIVVSDLREGVLGDRLASTLTDDAGAWSVELGPVDGLVRVDVLAGAGGDHRLSTVVEGLQLGEHRTGIQTTAITHLHAILFEALRGTSGWDVARSRSTALLFGHFAGLDHRRVAAADLSGPTDGVASEERVVALLLGGFSAQADRLRRGAPDSGDAATTLGLVEAYARDLEDGVLDGRNRFGGTVSFAGSALTSFSLRTDYADAVDAFTHDSAEVTGLDSSQIASVLAQLRGDESELFPAAESGDPGAVTWVEKAFMDSRGFALEEGAPLRGRVDLHARARSAVGIRAIRIEGEARTAFTADREPRSDDLWTSLETSALADGAHEIELVADTAAGTARARIDFAVDNRAPEIEVADVQGQSSQLRLHGHVSDASFPVTALLFVGGAEQGRVTLGGAGDFEAPVTVPCGEELEIDVIGVDAAGNRGAPVRVRAFCDADAPSLVLEPSSFIPETKLELEPDATGTGVSYRPPSGVMPTEISETASWPLTFSKFYNRLDSDAQGRGLNLPTFRFRASDGVGRSLPTLSYRYLIDGVEERAWSPLVLDEAGRAALVVSYQTFSPKLATRASALHTLEARVVDGVGHETVRAWSFQVHLLSPPLWIADCRPAVITWDQLHSVFGGAGGGTEFYSGTFAYPLDLPPGSLAPAIDLGVELTAAQASSEITAARFIKFRRPSFHETTFNEVQGIAGLCDAQGVSLQEDVYTMGTGEDALCFPGLAPVERVRAADRDWAPGGRTALPVVLRLGTGEGRDLPLDSSGHALWPAEVAQLRFGLFIQDPRMVLADGSRYDWPGAHSERLEPTGSTTNRYWLPTLSLDGREVPSPWFQGNPNYLVRDLRFAAALATARLTLPVPRIAISSSSLPLTVPLRPATECRGDARGLWTMEWRQ